MLPNGGLLTIFLNMENARILREISSRYRHIFQAHFCLCLYIEDLNESQVLVSAYTSSPSRTTFIILLRAEHATRQPTTNRASNMCAVARAKDAFSSSRSVGHNCMRAQHHHFFFDDDEAHPVTCVPGCVPFKLHSVPIRFGEI